MTGEEAPTLYDLWLGLGALFRRATEELLAPNFTLPLPLVSAAMEEVCVCVCVHVYADVQVCVCTHVVHMCNVANFLYMPWALPNEPVYCSVTCESHTWPVGL